MKTSEHFIRDRVDELDGLRGFLALWVLAAHILCWCGIVESAVPAKLRYPWTQFISGQAAVEVFMILSGFAISYLLHGRKQSYLDFMKGRFFRIYPVYLICLILGVLSSYLVPFILGTASWGGSVYHDYGAGPYAASSAHPLAHLFWHLTLLNGLVPQHVLPYSTTAFLMPAWSITLEWQYYLVAPFLARGVKSGLVVLGVVALLGLRFSTPWANPLLGFLPAQLPLFLIGIGSYHLYKWFHTSGRPRSPLFALPVAGMLVVIMLAPHFHAITLALWSIIFGSVFVRGTDLFSGALALVSRFLLLPGMQFFGKISYSIYLIHWPLILGLLALLLKIRPATSDFQAAAIMFVVAVPVILGAAVVLHYTVEAPGMAFGKRLVSRSRAQAEEKLAMSVSEAKG